MNRQDEIVRMSGTPGFLVHLEDPEGSGLAACNGRPFDNKLADREARRRGLLLVECPGCAIRAREWLRRAQ